MSSVVISGDTSGQVTLAAPAVAGTSTITLPASTGTAQLIGQGTAVNSTSGTAIDFTGIPSWAKRITVMFNGVSTSGTSAVLMQIGAGSITSTGYNSTSSTQAGTATSSTAGFLPAGTVAATNTFSGMVAVATLGSNVWVSSGMVKNSTTGMNYSAGDVTLSGVLDRVRITMANGTDTFDAGSINILYEG